MSLIRTVNTKYIRMNKFTLLLSFLLLSDLVYSQTENCAGAPSLTPGAAGAACSAVNGSTSTFTNDSGQGCAQGNEDDDGFYSFTATAISHTITVDGAANFDAVVGVFASCGGAAVTGGGCTNATNADGIETLTLTGLAIGTTYFIELHDWASDGGEFTICITTPSASTSNDDPCGAVSLTVNSSCTYTNGTTVGSTYANNAANGGTPTCASPGAPDVWYSFVATSATTLVSTEAGTITDGGMAVYSSSNNLCSGTLTQIGCDDDSGLGTMPELNLSGLTIGNTYFVRIWRYSSGTGTFGICVQSFVAISNDEPCGATTLSVGTSCSFNTYSNVGASTTAGVPAPGCASYSGNDIWFQVTVPASGQLVVDMQSGSLTDMGMAFYSGTCGSLTLLECDDDDSQNGAMPMLCWTGPFCGTGGCNISSTLTPGQTIWIRAWDYGGTDFGNFGICAYSPAATGTCASGLGTGVVNVGALPYSTSGTTCGSGNDLTSANTTTCGNTSYTTGEDQVFIFTPSVTGLVTMSVTSSGSYMGMSLYNNCPLSCIASAACVGSSQSSAGNQTISTCLTAGVTYYLVLDSWASPACNAYSNLSISAPVAPCPAAPIQDCVGGQTICSDLQVPGNASGPGSTSDLTVANDGCLSGENQTSWYFFSPQTSGTLGLTITPGASIDYDFAIWGPYPSGTTASTMCPPATSPIRCSFASGASTNTATGSYNTGIGSPAFSPPQYANPSTVYTEDGSGDGWVSGLNVTAGQVYMMVIDNFTANGTPFVLDWSLGAGATMNCIALNTELIRFDGSVVGNFNLIEWQTATETDMQMFILEHSVDGNTFSEIGKMNAAGNTSMIMGYAFKHMNPAAGFNYYRLKMVDNNNQFEYANSIVVRNFDDAPYTVHSLHPNPSERFCNIEMTSITGGEAEIVLLDISGKEAARFKTVLNKGIQTITIDLSQIPNGVYYVSILNGTQMIPGGRIMLISDN
jgi:hypothetical protein